MSKNRMIWLILEVAFYLLIVFLVLDLIYLFIEDWKENSVSTVESTAVIAEAEPEKIQQLNREEN